MAMGQVAEPGVHGGATGLVLPVAMVFVGCCLNSMTLEMIVREDPGSGTLITVTQFAFVAFEGILLKSIRGVGVARTVPLKHYFGMVAIFFAVSVANNVALGFKISMPLHMIFRSGSLITNLILGVVVMGKRHSTIKFLSVALVTAGIILCTWISGKRDDVKPAEVVDADALAYVVGLSILFFQPRRVVILRALPGVRVQKVREKLARGHVLFACACSALLCRLLVRHCATRSHLQPVGALHGGLLVRTPPSLDHSRGKCCHSVSVHPGCVHADEPVVVAHGHPAHHAAQICLACHLHLLLPQPVHGTALVGRNPRVWGNASLFRSNSISHCTYTAASLVVSAKGSCVVAHQGKVAVSAYPNRSQVKDILCMHLSRHAARPALVGKCNTLRRSCVRACVSFAVVYVRVMSFIDKTTLLSTAMPFTLRLSLHGHKKPAPTAIAQC
eukprot:Opistho-2@53095